MSQDIIVTTGALVGGNPNRLEIRTLIKNEKQFSLYIQALSIMSDLNSDESDPLSLFQIGGIHGLPPMPWNHSGGDSSASEEWKGYCTHSTVMFPTWHRPYICLFEQVLQQRALEIVGRDSSYDAGWKKAAEELRAPYWDWASREGNGVPPEQVIRQREITILTPHGHKTIKNPLLSYTFHPKIDPSFQLPFSQWRNTLRHPTNKGAHAKTDMENLLKFLSSNLKSIRSRLYDMFVNLHDWSQFSHSAAISSGNSTSLEGVHDTMHVSIGMDGHMGDAGYAGFDPIFYLHHANVDRLLSLWVAINPGFRFTSGSSEDGTWTIKAGTTVDDKTPLEPFRRGKGPADYWVSQEVFTTEKLGYTYPDFNGLDPNDPTYVPTLKKHIKRLYDDPFGLPGRDPTSPLFDWTVRVRVKKYELGGSFDVLFFLTPDDVEIHERSSPAFIGSHSVFANSATETCANCQNQAEGGLVIQGFVPLNHKIDELLGSAAGTFDPEIVKPYLTDMLKWKVEKVDGTLVQNIETSLSSLEVTVCVTSMTPSVDDSFPIPGEIRYDHDITRGRIGGSRDA